MALSKKEPAKKAAKTATKAAQTDEKELSQFQKAAFKLHDSAANGLPSNASETKLRFQTLEELMELSSKEEAAKRVTQNNAKKNLENRVDVAVEDMSDAQKAFHFLYENAIEGFPPNASETKLRFHVAEGG
jgi:cobyrinic acid a,c-diamide synthase